MDLNLSSSQGSRIEFSTEANPSDAVVGCKPVLEREVTSNAPCIEDDSSVKPVLSNYFASEVTAEDPFEAVFSNDLTIAMDRSISHESAETTSPVTASLDPSTALRLRQRDAWLPSETTRKALLNRKSGIPTGMPEIKPMLSKEAPDITTETRIDPYRALLLRYLADETAVDAIRLVPSCAESTGPNTENLMELITNGWYNAALGVTRRLLTQYGYTEENGGALLTPFTAQIWLARLALLIRLQNYDVAERELASFQTLDAPNVYFESAPELYPQRAGSIIPFSLRLLHAELPFYLTRPVEALDRLYYLLAIINRIQCNLRKGYTEDGLMTQPGVEYRDSSLNLWTCREARVLSSCLSIYLSVSDYPAAIETVHQLATSCSANKAVLRGLSIILGRIYLQMGDLETAKAHFAQAFAHPNSNKQPQLVIQELLHEAFLYLGKNEFEEAKTIFQKILEVDPVNVMAANNVAVCSLYLGQLSEAIRILESLTSTGLTSQPLNQTSHLPGKTNVKETTSEKCSALSELPRRFCLHDALVFNLAVLYEVESDAAMSKKVQLLERIARLPGEPVHFSSFKLQAS